VLELIQDTMVKNIERCSGHDGTYGVKSETLEFANKIARPIVTQIESQEPDHYGSDCPVAGRHIETNLKNKAKERASKNGGEATIAEPVKDAIHPIDLLCLAYGI
jgi:Fe-S oxidoreductase